MKYLRAALARIAGFLTGHRGDADLRDELQAHLEMGSSNIRYEDVKAAGDENGNTVAETLDIIERTVAQDRSEHPEEWA